MRGLHSLRFIPMSLLLLFIASAPNPVGAVDFDLLPPPSYANFSPYVMTVPILSPVKEASVTSAFGWRFHPITDSLDFHTGLDLANEEGTLIYAVLDGTVIKAEHHDSYGNYILLDHHNGFMTLYAHCQRLLVKEGDDLRRGDRIARMGETGDATGPHLHFEIRMDGIHLNPSLALRGVPFMESLKE